MSNEEKTVALVKTERQQVQRSPLEFSDEEIEIIKDQYIKNASPSEFRACMAIAVAKRLNPLKRQIYFRKQKEFDHETQDYVWRWINIIGIDGFRVIADRTGLYDGQDEPEFQYDEGEPCGKCGRRGKQLVMARVKVYRKDIQRAFVGVARLEEYVQTKRSGEANAMWSKMPHSQLAKCAEALAFRKAFPDDCGDLYAPEEFSAHQEDRQTPTDRMSAAPGVVAPALVAGSVQPVPGVSGFAAASSVSGGAALASAQEARLARLRASKDGADLDRRSVELAKEALTAAERKEVIVVYREMQQRFAKEKALQPTPPMGEPGGPEPPVSSDAGEREPGSEG